MQTITPICDLLMPNTFTVKFQHRYVSFFKTFPEIFRMEAFFWDFSDLEILF